MRHTALLAGLFAGMFLLVGCASRRYLEAQARLTSIEAVAKKPPDARYVVDPPDTIRVEVLSEEPPLVREVTLRQDGCITLPNLEDVKVGGLTTLEIREKLESLYSKYYHEPEVLVTVTAYRSKRIFVYGEVGRQGAIPYTGSQTIMDAIGAVGGVTIRAARSRVKVIRGDPLDPEVFEVDLDELLLHGDMLYDVSLAENDVVYVPPNLFARVGYAMDNLLFPFRGLLSAITTGQAIGAVSQPVGP